MFRNCSVPNCQSSAKTSSMHRFPKNSYIGEKWIKAICNPVLKSLPYHEVRRKKYLICSEHFEESAWYSTFFRKRLQFDAIPTLQLPDLQSSEAINSNLLENNVDLLDISINHENGEDETVIPNIFSLDEFSSSFSYSDSVTYVDITKLPIRKICNYRDSELSLSMDCRSERQSGDIPEEKFCSKNSSKSLSSVQDENLDTSMLQNIESNTLINMKRPKLDYMQKRFDISEKVVKPQLYSLESEDLFKNKKKPRLELSNENSNNREESAVIQIERVQSKELGKENSLNMDTFEIIECDQSINENSSVLRNLLLNAKVNKERPIDGGNTKRKHLPLSVGKVKRMECTNIERLERMTGNNTKQQRYRTTIRLKRQSKEDGNMHEDIFLIEHTFISSCIGCPNHKDDKVSCSIVKVE